MSAFGGTSDKVQITFAYIGGMVGLWVIFAEFLLFVQRHIGNCMRLPKSAVCTTGIDRVWAYIFPMWFLRSVERVTVRYHQWLLERMSVKTDRGLDPKQAEK